MSTLITDDQISSYQNDGVVLLKNVIEPEWLDVVAEGIEDNLRSPSKRTIEFVNDPANDAHFFFDARILGEVNAYDRFMLEVPDG